MTGFIAAAALATVLTLLLLLRPFFWRRGDTATTTSHQQLNAAIYRDQIAELERDRSEGALSEDDYRQARMELQRRALDDGAAAGDTAAVARAPKKTLLAIGMALPLAAAGLYFLIGNPAGVLPQQQHSVGAQQIEDMVARLATRLEKEPDNLEGWVMLARSYMAIRRLGEAEKAFDHAASLVEKDAQMLAVYADVAAANAGGNFAGKPMRLIEKSLKLDPDNLQALWLSGSAAFAQNRYDKAVTEWEHLLRLIPAESEDAKMLAANIAEARAKGGKALPAPSAPAKSATAKTAAPSAAQTVRGRVELAAAMKDKVAADAVLLVVAREAGGPRMPVAVMRARAADLPLEFALDDSMAVMPSRTISTVKEVEIEARVSKTGMATPEKGDLLSAVQNAKLGASGLRLVVDHIRP